jgi:ABC-type sugar transport system ATPase subunit
MELLEHAEVVLEVEGLGKSFPGVRALDRVSFRLHRGEVHAVVGENGAGKSTFMRVLAGLETPDNGEIRFHDRPVRLRDPHTARQLGVVMIHQELLPFLDLTVAENILMGREPTRGPLRWLDHGAMRREAQTLLERLEVPVSPDSRMRDLSVAEMQVVEIARAIGGRAEVIIMDEPTSALSEREARALFQVITDLRQHGIAIIYISHRLEEVFALADVVTVLRDGQRVHSGPVKALNRSRLIELMVGPLKFGIADFGSQARDAGPDAPSCFRTKEQAASRPGTAALAVRGLRRTGVFADVSFTVHCGEVVGLTGLVGAGRTAVASALFGLVAADAGEILVHGHPVRIRSPRQALDAGLALLTEDRKHDGLVLNLPVMHNLTLATLDRCSPRGWINHLQERRVADELIAQYGIKVADRQQATGTLSGGNQQKVALGKALLTEPDILILDEPTRGIDIGAKAEIYALIRRLAEAGKAILLVSSELPEVLALSHRILVMRQGRLSAELDPRRATPAEILHWAMPG